MGVPNLSKGKRITIHYGLSMISALTNINDLISDLLILGLGSSIFPISQETRKHINSLGIRIEVQDTRNAAGQFNLLATERGVTEVAAAMIPIGWTGS